MKRVPVRSTGIRLTVVLTIVLAAQLLLLGLGASAALAAPVAAAGNGFVSGLVYVDANGNVQADPDESSTTATVFVRSQADPTLVYQASTDAAGFYVLDGLPYGGYDVWAEAAGKTTGAVRTVGVGEVNATVTLDLPVIDNSNDLELTEIKLLFLPLLASHP